MCQTPAGARWLRCDLHVHTPFDPEKKFGENVKHAIEAFKKERTDRLAEIALRFVQACRDAAGGEGMDIVAVTDHNSIEGYRQMKPFFESIRQREDGGGGMPTILPGVEFTVGGERPIHFLVIFSPDTGLDEIESAIRHCFQENDRFDPDSGVPRSTGNSVDNFLKRIYEYCKPASGDRNIPFILLPAHADSDRGVARETGALRAPVAATIWDQMKGQLRERVISRRDWHGFETRAPFDKLPQSFRELLCKWAAARRNLDWDDMADSEKSRVREQRHWPLIQASDPHTYELIGTRYTWLKMEVPDIEGIRLSLLDPESRLRRMEDGPPGRSYPALTHISIRHTDFFEEVNIPLNPCLNTLIGGRGSGKSTVIECLRYAIDRARPEDFDEDEGEIREAVQKLLRAKTGRDYGETTGMLLPDHEVRLGLNVAGQDYSVVRSRDGFRVFLARGGTDQELPLDVRALIAPRVLSQRQIARIARDPAAQRRELDALMEPSQTREFLEQRRLLLEEIEQIQANRRRILDRLSTLPARETELKKVTDQMAFLERGGNKDVISAFRAFQGEARWMREAESTVEGLATELESQAARVEDAVGKVLAVPEGPTAQWGRSVSDRFSRALASIAEALRHQAEDLKAVLIAARREQSDIWQPAYRKAQEDYERLRDEMQSAGVEFGQHASLLQRRSLLEKEVKTLRGLAGERERADGLLHDARSRLVGLTERRLANRRALASTLESEDADIRIEIVAFGDRGHLHSQREEWFPRAGLQERDWEVLVDYVYSPDGSVPERLWGLVSALRTDVEAVKVQGPLADYAISATAKLLGSAFAQRLTRNFFNALERGERFRLDDMERFLPEDGVEARVRGADGTFRPITQGSIGQRSTAILSLLLSAGDQPLVIDQPEDDLDNQYVYDVVVRLLRKRKFSRQIIIATHNANIPVNGDAELILALGLHDRLGALRTKGSIDRPDVKDAVSLIMEGSAEAFRLRRERYGY